MTHMKYVLLCACYLLILSANVVSTDHAEESSQNTIKQRFDSKELNYYK